MKRSITYLILGLVAVALTVWLFRPAPLKVDTGRVERGSMQVTVDEQGEARSHDRFVVTAPVSGRMTRIELHDGDAVQQNQVVAKIAPLPLSVRERGEQTARVTAAASRQREAEELMRRAAEELAQAKREAKRIERLVKDGFMSVQAAEQARNAETKVANEAEAARFRAKSAAADVQMAKSGLVAGGDNSNTLFSVRSPVAGRILRIVDPSERVVAAGTPLLTVGDLSKLEVVIELLSSEAVKVKPGMAVIIEGWGGSETLAAKVQRIEPYAFTKVSALGVEEKRTNVVAEFVDPPMALGDGYRVNTRIVVWAANAVNKVPSSAVFRCAEGWCTFVVENGRAKRRDIKIGQRNVNEAEVLAGLTPEETVIRHPANAIEDGARVESK